MAPTTWPIWQGVTTSLNYRRDRPTYGDWRDVHNTESFIVEGWGEGFMFGALLMMVIITIANMRRGILLHKVILLEVSDGLAERGSCAADELVTPRDEPWHLLLHVIQRLWLVPLIDGRTALLLLLHAQRCGVDEDQAFLHRRPSFIQPSLLHRGALDLFDDTCDDNPSSHI
jgi:hypothetical protein